MILRVQIVDDNGEVLAQAEGPVHQPVQWKSPPNQPLIAKRPKTHDGVDNGAYHVFTVTAQPLCTLVLGGQVTPVQFPQNPPAAYPPINIPGPNPISGYPTGPVGNPLGDRRQ